MILKRPTKLNPQLKHLMTIKNRTEKVLKKNSCGLQGFL